MFNRRKVGLIVAEFIAAFMLSMVVLGASRYFNFTAPWYVGLAAGVTLALLVAMVGRVSGAHANPAITIGLWTLRKIETSHAIVYVAAQMLGGAVALVFLEYVTNLDVLQAGSGAIDARVYVAEIVGTAVFAMGVAAAVTQKLEGFHQAFTIGAALFIGILIAAVAAPGYLNPAVALANNTWDWTVTTAPIVGSVLGMNIYSLFLAPTEALISPRVTVTTRRKGKK